MEVPTRSHLKDLDVPDATFTPPDLTTFTRLDVLGLEVTAQLLEPDRTVLACRVVEPDDWCRRCGCQGVPRDTVTRELAHEPFGWRPTTLLLTVRRYRCTECAHVWRQDTTAAAEPRAKISRAGLRWGLVGIVVQHLSMARVAEGLGVSWNTAPQSSHPQDPYILCLTASPQHPRYALRIRKSRIRSRMSSGYEIGRGFSAVRAMRGLTSGSGRRTCRGCPWTCHRWSPSHPRAA